MSWTCPEKGESADKRRKRLVDSLTGKSKLCLIHGSRHSSNNVRSWETSELSTLIVGPPRTAGAVPHPEKINKQQENNAIVNNAMDEILLTKKLSSTNHEAPEFLDYDYNANNLYEVGKMNLEETI